MEKLNQGSYRRGEHVKRMGAQFFSRKRITITAENTGTAVALCMSEACARKRVVKSSWRCQHMAIQGVIKSVDRRATWCPDCGDALYWQPPIRSGDYDGSFNVDTSKHETHLRAFR